MSDFIKTTELDSNYDHLESMSVNQLLTNINKEDPTIAMTVQRSIPQIETLIETLEFERQTIVLDA